MRVRAGPGRRWADPAGLILALTGAALVVVPVFDLGPSAVRWGPAAGRVKAAVIVALVASAADRGWVSHRSSAPAERSAGRSV